MSKADRQFAKFLLATGKKLQMQTAFTKNMDSTPSPAKYNPRVDPVKSRSPSATIKMSRIDQMVHDFNKQKGLKKSGINSSSFRSMTKSSQSNIHTPKAKKEGKGAPAPTASDTNVKASV